MIGCGTGDETALQSDTRDSPAVGVIESRDLATRIEPSAQHRTVVIPAEGSSCTSNTDCAGDGPWRTCQSERCVVEPRTFLLRRGIEEPTPFRRVLNDILGASIEGGQLNLLVHLGTTENWLIPGVLTGAMDGMPTCGQSQPDGDYVGRGRTHCQGGFVHRIGSNRVERDMTIRVPV